MLMREVRLSKVGPISLPLELTLDSQVNVLIGPNSSGKTTILSQLAAYNLSRRFAGPISWWGDRATAGPGWWQTQISYSPIVYIPSIRLPFPKLDNIVPEYTFINEFHSAANILDGRAIVRFFDDYFAGEFRESVEYAHIDLRFLNLDFDFDYEGSKNKLDSYLGKIVADRKKSIMETAAACAAKICREVLTSDVPSGHSYSPTRVERGVSEVTLEYWREYTNDQLDEGESITTGELSSGTQGPRLWILWIALQLHKAFLACAQGNLAASFIESNFENLDRWLHTGEGLHYRDVVGEKGPEGWGDRELQMAEMFGCRSNDDQWRPDYKQLASHGFNEGDSAENFLPGAWKIRLDDNLSAHPDDIGTDVALIRHNEWQKMPFVLLIDEIENHLHPTWQRRMIPALREYFPNVQIIATTHSPFVIAGLKAGQVHLLNRDANGVITASTNTEDVIGWTADEILRTLMGVDDPTDDTTAAAARELRQLRDEGPRADESEEERRQVEMQRLRRLVNRDLLAGGPREAQRELFEQQFAEALEKYLRSQDLNQDNG